MLGKTSLGPLDVRGFCGLYGVSVVRSIGIFPGSFGGGGVHLHLTGGHSDQFDRHWCGSIGATLPGLPPALVYGAVKITHTTSFTIE